LELLTSLDASDKEELAKLKAIAVRRGLWFKVLSAAERAIVDLTLKVVKRVRSSVLKEVLKLPCGLIPGLFRLSSATFWLFL
jgi:hypothetical protein